MTTRRMALLALLAALVALVIAALLLWDREKPGELPARAVPGAVPSSERWYADPDSAAVKLLPQDPGLAPIALRPKFAWFGPFAGPDRLALYLDRAAAVGRVGLVALFNVEARECGDLEAAKAFYRAAAGAIGGREALVAFEPDSMGTMDLDQTACFDAIRYGLGLFAALPRAQVFMEAGASDWEGPTRMVKKLRRVGVCRVGGVLVNATHADWTHRNIRYGRELDRLLTGCRLRIMVNTAENGRGPNPKTQPRHWCDVHQRYGLGRLPQYPTHHAGVLFAWVNRPGYTQKCYDPPVRFASYRAHNLIERASLREGP